MSAPRICICDDDLVIGDLLTLELKGAGFDMAPVARDTSEALQVLQGAPVDVLLLDLHMPNGGGLEFLGQLSAAGFLNRTKVLMLTAEEDLYFIDKAKRLGASGYLTKPFDSQDLIGKLRRLTADRRVRWIDDISTLTAPAASPAPRPRSADTMPMADLSMRRALSPGERKRILSVEDTPMNQQLISLFLPTETYIIDQVQTGRQALEAVRDRLYDLILMDLRLPDIDGLEIIRTIRESGGVGRTLPIIALSADVMPRHIAAARDAGADEHLAKPFSADSLRSAVERAIRSRLPVSPENLNNSVASLTHSYGKSAVEGLLKTLKTQLDRFETSAATRGDAEFAAHAIKGAAGSLGFSRVATACKELESACQTGLIYEVRLHEAQMACRHARDEIAHYLGA